MNRVILLLLLLAPIAFGASDAPQIDPSDDFSPMLFPFALVGICIVLFLIGAGIVVATIVAISTSILVAFGIISSAAFVGILRRRFSSGLRAFHYQICAVATIPAGIGALWVGAHFFTMHLRHRDIFTIGTVAGISAGLLSAFAFDRLAGIAYRHFVTPSISDIASRTRQLQIERRPQPQPKRVK